MSSLIRALAASGSSPQLQQACAKVTVAMARYTIDPSMSIEDAEEIIRGICDPLAEALAGSIHSGLSNGFCDPLAWHCFS